MDQRTVNYVGWLGHQNLGDEAVYTAAKRLFNTFNLVPYNYHVFFPLMSPQRFPKSENLLSHVIIVGGGTLLPDLVTYVKPSKYNYIFGTGVKDTIFRYRLDNMTLRRLKSFNFRLVGVRDYFSKQMLDRWGIESEVIGDPVLSLKPDPQIRRNESKIAINIGCDGHLWGGSQEKVVESLTEACLSLKSMGYDLILVPFSRQDLQYMDRISKATETKVFNKWLDSQSVINLLASCKVLIGERLHSVICSAAAGTPFICLEYRPKCRSFSEVVGFSEYTARTDKVTAERIKERFIDLLKNWNEMNNLLKRKVKETRERQRKFAQKIVYDINSLPDDAWSISGLQEKIKNKIFWGTEAFIRRNLGGHGRNVWLLYNRFLLRIMRYLV